MQFFVQISVAGGLECAENFLYVLVLGGTQESDGDGPLLEEWNVMFFRSIFPIHALAAAMQNKKEWDTLFGD